MKPYIGITCGEIRNQVEPWSPITYGQSRTYVEVVLAAGGVPVLLPLSDDTAVLRQLFELCGGILFAGGNDIDPALYGQDPIAETVDVSKRRDSQESLLLDWTLADNKSMLGICRGMQLVNIKLGGSLYQDIGKLLPNARDHESSTHAKSLTHTAHMLRIAPGSKFSSAVGVSTIETNSHHHQAVDELGSGLVASAWAEDGLIEALEHSERQFIVGVQSHPESLTHHVPAWQSLFKAFVQASV